MTDNAVHVSPVTTTDTPAEANRARPASNFGIRNRRGFVTAFIIGTLLTLVGAIETGELPFWPRLAYWQTLMMSGALIGIGVSEGVQSWGGLHTRKWAEIVLTALLIALPLTLLVVGTSVIFFGISTPGLKSLAIMFGITFVISLTMTLLNYMMAPPVSVVANVSRTVAAGPPMVAEPPLGRFIHRLPLPMRSSRIIALQAEDHYLRVHFYEGKSTLILMRLSDAISELPTNIGAQTHRSWWVAKDAVQTIAKSDGRATLALRDDLEAPVSRSHFKSLNEAGWLI